MAATIATDTRTISRRLADYVHSLRFEDIAPEAIDKLKDHLISHIGLAFSGLTTVEGTQAVSIATALAEGRGGTTVIGTSVKVPPLESAFANCTLMRAKKMDDVLFPVGVHAGLMTIPVALALGEQHHRSGKDVLTAIIAGYDVIGKLGNMTWSWSAATPRRPTIPFGPFGSAVTSAKLLRLGPEAIAEAVGYAAHSAMGLAEGPLTTHYYSLVARNGLTGALLAQAGGTTTPKVLEGQFGFYRTFFGEVPSEVERHLATLGREFEIMNATTKRYDGTGLNIVPIQLMLDLVARERLSPANVARIRLELPEERINFGEGHAMPPYGERGGAASSVPFRLASIVLDGRMNEERCDDFNNPDVLAIVARSEVVMVPGRKVRYARIEVTTTDGTKHVVEGDSYEFPRAEWIPWMRKDGDAVVSASKIERAASMIGELEELEDISELMACLIRDR